MMAAFKAAGFAVIILTGTSAKTPPEQIWQEKAQYLSSLGCGNCWDEMVVIATPTSSTEGFKAKWCIDNEVDVLIDNSKDNAKEATEAGVPLVLVPWATRK